MNYIFISVNSVLRGPSSLSLFLFILFKSLNMNSIAYDLITTKNSGIVNRRMVKRLNKLCKKTNSTIVLLDSIKNSTVSRYFHEKNEGVDYFITNQSILELVRTMEEVGITHCETMEYNNSLFAAISDWLCDHRCKENNYVILHSDQIMPFYSLDEKRNRQVITRHKGFNGLRSFHMREVINKLS